MYCGCLFMPQVLHLTTSSTGSHCIHSLTNSASIQSTDIDSGLNTRLLKVFINRFTLFSLPSTSPIHLLIPFLRWTLLCTFHLLKGLGSFALPLSLAPPPASSAACAPAPSSGWIPAVRTIVPRSHLLVATGTPSPTAIAAQ
ncbi:hypothetical protein ASPFODRAFT_597745 [Aspergillus luchuensis CBS 106.47]|uniref:Uncharacterized protein n=1 Tax=Aspergillus luchuensis (strain CBS 106.47) TaxID=1137211 RepID=A0A1M3THV0_ASPLC|nr:hypothetical protein ASPFODRAFT_597745 [Aspergillus luchuensis CBS 106.47]